MTSNTCLKRIRDREKEKENGQCVVLSPFIRRERKEDRPMTIKKETRKGSPFGAARNSIEEDAGSLSLNFSDTELEKKKRTRD